ncbi:unnamed protein product [Orchesella dallaii]|uniref:Chitin-binding type-2 domain-containing protein n=1 Tax=Orchesella dallaii TaxID=48710 RepID=A0ABP1Q1M4_9HEXA
MSNPIGFSILTFVLIVGVTTMVVPKPLTTTVAPKPHFRYDFYTHIHEVKNLVLKTNRQTEFVFLDNLEIRTPDCRKDGYRLQVFDNCDVYAECENGIPYMYRCREDEIFDTITKECVDPKKGECKYHCKHNYHLVYRDYFQKEKYFICLDGGVTDFSCPKNWHFDIWDRECEEGENHIHGPQSTTTRRPPPTSSTLPPRQTYSRIRH